MEGHKVSFVTWPDGKVSSESLTVCGEQLARELLIVTWLPERYFGKIDSSVCYRLWEGMRKNGFKSHTVEIGADGKPVLEKSE